MKVGGAAVSPTRRRAVVLPVNTAHHKHSQCFTRTVQLSPARADVSSPPPRRLSPLSSADDGGKSRGGQVAPQEERQREGDARRASGVGAEQLSASGGEEPAVAQEQWVQGHG